MGFTTGFTGGVTLTLGVAYLTVLAHERNRQAQAQQLQSQSRVLTSLLEPAPIPPPQTRAELAREERSTLIETAKDRWNEEVENAVRWAQRTDWNDVRENLEATVTRVLNGQKGQPAVEEVSSIASAAKAKAQEVTSSAREGTSSIGEAAKAKSEQATTLARHKLDIAQIRAAELRDAANSNATRIEADTKSGAHGVAESIRNSGGTVDAARGAVRGAISKGIERGKEVIGKAQFAVGLVEEKVGSSIQAASGSSAVEKALEERYEKSFGLDKTVEQTLAERYMPVDSRDNSHLRGV